MTVWEWEDFLFAGRGESWETALLVVRESVEIELASEPARLLLGRCISKLGAERLEDIVVGI